MSMIESMKLHGAAQLAIEKEHEVCDGFVRAEQSLAIGRDAVAVDEILIEEVHYPSAERMRSELDSLSIKSGMFSPFADATTPPPKYCYADDRSATAWFVTSVPRTSARQLLSALPGTFPQRYVWNRALFALDVARRAVEALRTTWSRSRNPFHLFAAVRDAVTGMLDLRVPTAERLRWAATIVDAVHRRHGRQLIQNNITADTLFFSDALSPRFLGSYSGRQPSVMKSLLPPELQESGKNSPDGGAFVDVYCLSLLAYEIITGAPLAVGGFRLDAPTAVPPEPPRLDFRFPAGALAFLNPLLDLADDLFQALMRFAYTLGALLDETKWPNYRRLVRSSGGVVRTLPGIRLIADIAFPTRAARALRSVLDRRRHHDAVTTGGHRPVNTALLRSVLPKRCLTKTNRLAAALQKMIDGFDGRIVETADEERSLPHLLAIPEVRRSLRYTLWGLAGAALLLAIDRSQVENLAAVNTPDTASVAAPQNAVNRKARPVSSQLLGVPPKPAERAAETRPIAVVVPPRVPSHESGPCRPYLTAEEGYPNLYQILDMTAECDVGDLIFTDSHGQTTTLRSATDGFAKYFVLHRLPNGWSRIVPIRLCMRDHGSYAKGVFYEAVGYADLGERTVLADGDLLAFNWFSLNRYKNEHP
jgi:hypothetical protein